MVITEQELYLQGYSRKQNKMTWFEAEDIILVNNLFLWKAISITFYEDNGNQLIDNFFWITKFKGKCEVLEHFSLDLPTSLLGSSIIILIVQLRPETQVPQLTTNRG